MFSTNQTLNGLDNLDDLDVYSIKSQIIDSNQYLLNGQQLNTDGIPEGNTNLYYTDLRVENVVNPILDDLLTEIDNTYYKKIGGIITGDVQINNKLYVDNIDKLTTNSTLTIGETATNINIGCGSNIQTVNIGSNNSLGTTTINLGGTNDIVNIQGTLNSIQTTNTEVYDKNITLNKGSILNQSARSAGFSIRDNNNDNQGYIITDDTDGQGFKIKAPENTGIVRIRPSTGLTSEAVITNGNQTINGIKTFSSRILSGIISNRCFVLFDGPNDHQFSGFGINADQVRYQVTSNVAHHTFFCGTNSTTSTQLMRIRGDGNLIVGSQTTSNTRLLVQGTTQINDASTLLSTLNISGITTLNNNCIINGTTTFNNNITNNNSVYLQNRGGHSSQLIGNADAFYIQAWNTTTLVNDKPIIISGRGTDQQTITALISTQSVLIGGNVGELPTYKLDIKGDTNVSNNSIYRISGISVLSSNTLGSGVVNSSLTSVGNLNNLTVNGASTLLNTLNVSGSTLIRGDLVVSGSTNFNINNLLSLNVSSTTTLHGPITAMSSLNVSGLTVLNNNVSINSTLNISGITKLHKIDAPDVDPSIGDGERELIIGDTNCNTLYLGCSKNQGQVINIGTANTNQSTINIGNLDRNSLIFIEGTILMRGNITSSNVVHSDLYINNKQIYLNVGGGVNTLGGAGLFFNENGTYPAHIYIDSGRNYFRFKCPVNTQECFLEFDNSGQNFTINKTKIDKIHDILTLGTSNGLTLNNQELSLSLSGVSSTGSLHYTDFTRFNSLETSKWNQLGNNIYNKNIGNNVGIGTLVPNYFLDVQGGDININSSYNYKVDGVNVLNSTTLGSGIINSSLKSVGTLNNLLVTGNTTLLSNLQINNNVRVGASNQVLNNQFEIYKTNTPALVLNHDFGTYYTLQGNATQFSIINSTPVNPSLTKRFAYSTGGVEKLSIDGPTGNLNISNNSNYQISGITVLNSTTLGSGVVSSSLTSVGNLNNLTVNGGTTFVSTLNISGNSTLQGASTLLSSLNVSGITTLNNTIINGASTILSTLNISGITTLNNTIINGASTLLSSLNVSGITTLNNNCIINGTTTFNNNITNNNSVYLQNRGGHSSQLVGNAFAFYIQAWNTSTLLNDKPIILCGRNTGSPTLNADIPSASVLIGGAQTPAYKLDVLGDTNIQNGAVYRISGISVLSSNTLGSGVIFSDLQKVGTLNTLDVFGNCTMNSNLYVSGTVNLSSSSNYQISNVSVLNYSQLGLSVNKSSLQSVGILDNLTITGNTTLYSSLNVSGSSIFKSKIYMNGQLTNRVIELFRDNDNDHEYHGFGVNSVGAVLRYQISDTLASHAWYAGVNSTTSNQLMRIRGDGNVIIGTNTTTNYKLDINGDVNVSNGSIYRISGVSVLSSNTLGSGVVSSSLTSVGTLNNLTVTGGTTLNTTLNVSGNTTLKAKLFYTPVSTALTTYLVWDYNNSDEIRYLSSDMRIKKNIRKLKADESEFIYKIKVHTYQDKYEPSENKNYLIGPIAQQIIDDIPTNKVVNQPGEYYSVDDRSINYSMLNEVQKLKKVIDKQQKRILTLEKRQPPMGVDPFITARLEAVEKQIEEIYKLIKK